MQQLLVEESWRVLQPLLESPPPVHSCTPGTWGPEAAAGLAGPYRGWHGPWVPR